MIELKYNEEIPQKAFKTPKDEIVNNEDEDDNSDDENDDTDLEGSKNILAKVIIASRKLAYKLLHQVETKITLKNV